MKDVIVWAGRTLIAISVMLALSLLGAPLWAAAGLGLVYSLQCLPSEPIR